MRQSITGLASFLCALVVLVPLLCCWLIDGPFLIPGALAFPDGAVTVEQGTIDELENAYDKELYIENLTRIYETVIVVLTVFIGLISGLAFWSVRLLSKDAIEEVTIEAVNRIILDSKKFEATLDQKIDDQTFEKISTLGEAVEAISINLNKIDEKYGSIDGFIASFESIDKMVEEYFHENSNSTKDEFIQDIDKE